MSESFWLLPLFFVAIAAGFFLGKRESKRRQRRRMASLSKDYVAGINFWHAWGLFLNCCQDLNPLDGINAKVSLKVHAKL